MSGTAVDQAAPPAGDTMPDGTAVTWPRLAAAVTAIMTGWAALLGSMDVDWVPNDAKLLYLPTARNLLQHGAYSVMDQEPYLPTITKMPGYSFFLAAEQAIFGEGLAALQAFQLALVGVTALLCADLARRLFDRRTATVAAVLVAGYPAFAVHAMEPLSETLTGLLLTANVHALVRHLADPAAGSAGRPGLRRAATHPLVQLGITTGLLVLVRQSFAPVLVAQVVAVAATDRYRGHSWRPALARAGVVAGLAVALIAPWCVRNIAVSDRLLPFGANSGLSLLVSVRQYADGPGTRPEYLDTIAAELATIDAAATPAGTAPGMGEGLGGGPAREVALDEALTRRARGELAEVPTARLLGTVPARLVLLWSGASMIELFDRIELLLMAASLLSAAALGLRRRACWPLWLPAAFLTAVHLVFHAEERYTLPARPALLVLGAAGLVGAVRAGRRLVAPTTSGATP
ncbi:MAG: ArnT family glycosyltransferase [Acidimicrobiia bacterium]